MYIAKRNFGGYGKDWNKKFVEIGRGENILVKRIKPGIHILDGGERKTISPELLQKIQEELPNIGQKLKPITIEQELWVSGPITKREFKCVMGYEPPYWDFQPERVGNVSIDEALEFVEKLKPSDGEFRLPEEKAIQFLDTCYHPEEIWWRENTPLRGDWEWELSDFDLYTQSTIKEATHFEIASRTARKIVKRDYRSPNLGIRVIFDP